ncbi:MAG: ImmA/IrrE family metallo-endopeptidase [Bacteroidales bacterium]|nr:ImmA/IrrE family metallo-endopeptidase [Bacteroidales bacterium]
MAEIIVNPNILTWAIERVGMKVEEYSAENKDFKAWLEGTKSPTLKKIEDFAKRFYVPFGYMFLETPPEEKMPITFFRKTNNAKQNVNIYDTIRNLKEKQDWLVEYLREDGFETLEFVSKFANATEKDINEICDYIHQILNLNQDWAYNYSNEQTALSNLSSLIENIGVITIFNSVVGFNNSRKLLVKDCRGFSLVDDIAPFIFINSRDAKVAQIFTLIHEFAHILIGYSAGFGEEVYLSQDSSKQEKICDKIAAEFLVPNNLFKKEWGLKPYNYEYIARKFKVSRFVILRKAVENKFIDIKRYNELYNEWLVDNTAIIQHKKNGGNFRATAIKKSSKTFLIHLSNALNDNKILYRDAYNLVGMKGDTFHKIINSKEFLQ